MWKGSPRGEPTENPDAADSCFQQNSCDKPTEYYLTSDRQSLQVAGEHNGAINIFSGISGD